MSKLSYEVFPSVIFYSSFIFLLHFKDCEHLYENSDIYNMKIIINF